MSKGISKTAFVTEKAFESQVKDLAKLFGWKYYHPFLSKWSERGYPDITLVKENEDGTASLLFLELKSERGKVTEAQQQWINILSKVPNVGAYIFYPHAWDRIVLILRGLPDKKRAYNRRENEG